MPGVYQIWINDYFYFGSAEDIYTRCVKTHFALLKNGKHSNKKMQNVYNKHNIFRFDIIIECDSRDAAYAYEQDFIDTHFGLEKCMNLNPDASNPPSQFGKPGHWLGKKRKGWRWKSNENHRSHALAGKTIEKIPCPLCNRLIAISKLSYHQSMSQCKNEGSSK